MYELTRIDISQMKGGYQATYIEKNDCHYRRSHALPSGPTSVFIWNIYRSAI